MLSRILSNGMGFSALITRENRKNKWEINLMNGPIERNDHFRTMWTFDSRAWSCASARIEWSACSTVIG